MNEQNVYTVSLLVILCNSLLVSSVPLQERILDQSFSNVNQAHNPFMDISDPDLSTFSESDLSILGGSTIDQTVWGEGDIKFPPHGVGYKPPNPDYEVYTEMEEGLGSRIGTRDQEYTEVSTESALPFTEASSRTTAEVYQREISTSESQHQSTRYEPSSTTPPSYQPTQTPLRRASTTELTYEHDQLPMPKCSELFQAYDDFTGTCYHLATQGPCKGNQWWILDEVTQQPECTHRPCPPFYAQSPQTGECVISEEAKVLGLCGDSERLVNDVYGKSRCQCRSHAYRWKDGVCYPIYQRGPCEFGYYYLYSPITNQPSCEPNICLEDNKVEVDGQCYHLGDTCGESGDKNIYINPHNGVLGCYDFFRLPIQQTKI